jgi:hypothetical protein
MPAARASCGDLRYILPGPRAILPPSRPYLVQFTDLTPVIPGNRVAVKSIPTDSCGAGGANKLERNNDQVISMRFN